MVALRSVADTEPKKEKIGIGTETMKVMKVDGTRKR